MSCWEQTCKGRYNQIPYHLAGRSSNWRIITQQRFSHRRDSPEPHVRLPSPGIWHQKDKPQKTGGNTDLTFKYTQNFMCTGIQGKSSNLIGAWATSTCWSWRVSWRGKRRLRLTLRTQDTGGRHNTELSTTWTLLVAAILAHLHQDLAPPNNLKAPALGCLKPNN